MSSATKSRAAAFGDKTCVRVVWRDIGTRQWPSEAIYVRKTRAASESRRSRKILPCTKILYLTEKDITS